MEKLKNILNWPAKKSNNFRPAYSILWRLIWVPVIYSGLAIFCIGIFMVDGREAAIDTWNRAV